MKITAFFSFLLVIISLTQSVNAQTKKGDNFSYTITDTWLEGSSGTTEMIISQSGDLAVATFPGQTTLKQVSDPSAGIRSAFPERNIPVLVNIIEEKPTYRKGSQILVDGREVKIDSITYSLEKGKEKMKLLGFKADHSILTIDLVWSEGDNTKGNYHGKADLWTIKKLPFSWLPYTIPDGFTKAVVPLSFNIPDLASYLLLQYEAELKNRGLLVKAEVEYTLDQSSNGFEMSNNYVRKVEVSDLKAISEEIPDIPDKTLVSSDQYKYIFGALMVAGRTCEKGVGEASFQLEKEGNVLKLVQGSGIAEIAENDDQKSTSMIAMGVLNQQNSGNENGCMVIGIKPQEPEAGIYYMSPGKEVGPELDFAFVVNAENENPLITYIEEGSLELMENGDMLKARLQGSGWSFKMDRTSGEMTEGVQVRTTFDLKLKAETPEIGVPEWTPLEIDHTSHEKTTEITFDQGASVHGTIDALGKIAAVSLKNEPFVKVLDLESGEELSTIEVPMSFGFTNMSLSMAPSGSSLAIGITGGKVLIANPLTGEITNQWRYPQSGNAFTEVKPIVFNEKRNQLVGASKGHTVVWDIENGNPVYEWEENTYINDIGVTSNGDYAMRIGGDGLRVWDLEKGTELCKNSSPGPAIAIHPDGQTVAAIDYERKVTLYSTKDCGEITSWNAGEGWSPNLSWAADGQHLIMTDYRNGQVMIRDAYSGEIITEWAAEVSSRTYAPTHKHAIMLVGPKVIFWE